MSSVFIGQIIQGGWNFAPRGFQSCSGQLLSISQNSALFSLLGISFGGDGSSTFGVPDLRGRSMVGSGQGSGLAPYTLGQLGGTENTTLSSANLPAHTHSATFASTSSLNAAQVPGANQQAQAAPGSMLGRSVDTSPANAVPKIYVPNGSTPAVPLGGLNVAGTVTVAPAGSSAPFNNLSPFQVVTMVIALQGLFPSRN